MAKVAQDHLAIPAAEVDIERLFNGIEILVDVRLSDVILCMLKGFQKSIFEALPIGAWSRKRPGPSNQDQVAKNAIGWREDYWPNPGVSEESFDAVVVLLQEWDSIGNRNSYYWRDLLPLASSFHDLDPRIKTKWLKTLSDGEKIIDRIREFLKKAYSTTQEWDSIGNRNSYYWRDLLPLASSFHDSEEHRTERLTPNDWRQLSDIKKILAPFNEYTEYVARDSPSTIITKVEFHRVSTS
jgi:hypothetical protein